MSLDDFCPAHAGLDGKPTEYRRALYPVGARLYCFECAMRMERFVAREVERPTPEELVRSFDRPVTATEA